MPVIQREGLETIIPDVGGLLQAHWEEIALHRETIKLSPDWDSYRRLERKGSFIAFTVREGGVLIGYSAFFLSRHPHYKECVTASNDVIYLSPECRGPTGIRLLGVCESALKELGVTKITWHIKPKHDWSPLLIRRGYDQEELIFAKLL